VDDSSTAREGNHAKAQSRKGNSMTEKTEERQNATLCDRNIEDRKTAQFPLASALSFV
jgi:hypothetical protein